jgi:hypothetical protein
VLVNNVGLARWSGRLGDTRLTPVDFVAAGSEVSKFAMTITFAEVAGTVRGTLSYRGDLITAAEAERMAVHIAGILNRFAELLGTPVCVPGPGQEPDQAA